MPTHFHLCLSPDAIESGADLLRVVKEAGISDIWVAGFLYGHWYYSLERIQNACRAVRAAGMAAHVVNLPLGHPGDSLGAQGQDVPLGPPAHWQMGVRADGSAHSGTSLHPPAVAENCAALGELHAAGVDALFLDDDFRLAVAPGEIGGCFCPEHRQRFLARQAASAADWEQLLRDVASRSDSPLLREWVNFSCDELTAAFRAQQVAAPGLDLGIMVMYLGAEKAGIRLEDYRGTLFRVGEFMFDDRIFGMPKGKTDELFSVLFHRRFTTPERCFSESTAFPADQLSAANLAAKLVIAQIAEVGNVMLMSGLTPFPRGHWPRIAEAIVRQRRLQPLTAGAVPRGPFQHYWGEASRFSGADQPYSLFLALGVPFEVVDEPGEGWCFLSQADALERQARGSAAAGVHFIFRPGVCAPFAGGQAIEETLPALFAFKHSLIPLLQDVPYIEQDLPVVCAWYPQAGCALIWNLSERAECLTLRLNDWTAEICLDGLEAGVVGLPPGRQG